MSYDSQFDVLNNCKSCSERHQLKLLFEFKLMHSFIHVTNASCNLLSLYMYIYGKCNLFLH